MRVKKYILILTLVTAFIALAINYGWDLLKVNQRLKVLLLQEIRPLFRGRFDVQDLRVGLGSVNLKGVDLQWQNDLYSLWIKDLRVGYRLVNLLRYGLKAEKVVSSIMLVHPRFTLKNVNKGRGNITDEKTSFLQDRGKDFSKFSHIKRLIISQGEVVMLDSTGQETVLIRDINGWLDSGGLSHATVQMAGKLFNSRHHNLLIRGGLNIAEGRLGRLEIELKEFKMTEGLPLLVPPYMKVLRGSAEGRFLITEDRERGLDIEGRVNLHDGALEVVGANLYLDDINYSAEIRDWDLIFEDASQRFNGSRVVVRGMIADVFHPRFDLQISSESFNIGGFLNTFCPNFPFKIRGLSSLHLSLAGYYENPHLESSFLAERVKFNQFTFKSFRGNIVLRDSLLTIKGIKARCLDSEIDLRGFIDLTTPGRPMAFKFTSKGDLFPVIQRYLSRDLRQCDYSLEAEISGGMNAPRVHGALKMDFSSQGMSVMGLKGEYSLRNDSLEVDLSSDDGEFTLKLNVTSMEDNPLVNLSVTGFGGSWWRILNHPLKERFGEDLKINLIAAGRLSDMKFRMEGVKDERLVFSITGRVKDKRRIEADIRYARRGKSLKGQIALLLSSDLVKVNSLKIGDFLSGRGEVNLRDEKRVKGELSVSDADLQQLVELFYGDSSFGGQGNINGKVTLGGTLNNIQAQGEFELTEGSFNGIRSYGGEVSFKIADRRFCLENFSLERNREVILSAEGSVGLQDGGLNLLISGNRVDASALRQIFTQGKGLINGSSSFNIHVRGTKNSPLIGGEVSIEKGRIWRISFDELRMTLCDRPEDVHEGGRIKIAEFSLSKEGSYRLKAHGGLPLSPTGEIDIHLEAEGDILSILPEAERFFQQAHGRGKLNLYLTGSAENPIIGGGYLKVWDGYLKLASLAKEIKNFTVRIELQPESRFLEIANISGSIGDGEFRIYNLQQIPKLSPLYLPKLDLNLGILVLETSPKGIPLNLPGIMEKGEEGWFEAVGKTGEEKFYLAGPFENPLVRGTIKLRDVSLTYPPVKKGSANKTLSDLLKRINWDLSLVSVKGNRYFRRISGLLDDIYINLQIDNQLSQLNFTGSIKDGSFQVEGRAISTLGTMEYLDQSFLVEDFGIEFTPGDPRPIVYGRAKTTVTDSLGFPWDVYLTLYTVDRVTGEECPRGRWGEIRFKLSTNNPAIGTSQTQILAALGYSIENLKKKAPDIIGISTDNLVFRPLFRPFERRLERSLGLDMVRFSSHLTRNLIEMNFSPDKSPSRMLLLRSTRVMLGKYLTSNLFLVYTGQLEAGLNPHYQQKGMGLRHTLGLEYRINPSLLLELEYDYDSLLLWSKEDKRIWLRHTFPF